MPTVTDNLETAGKALEVAEKSAGIIERILDVIPSYRANKLLINEIENNPNLTAAEKIAFLYNHKSIKNQIKNTAATFTLTDLLLKENGKSLEKEIPKLDEDWFDYYCDIIKNFSNEEMQFIWAKILSRECEKHGSVSKQLISILQVIDTEEAKIFSYICSHSLNYKFEDESCYVFVYPRSIFDDNKQLKSIFEKANINDTAIVNLESLGLISYSLTGYGFKVNKADKVIIEYYGEEFQINDVEDIPLGNISLTKCGIELVNVLHESMKNKKDLEYFRCITECLYTHKN